MAQKRYSSRNADHVRAIRQATFGKQVRKPIVMAIEKNIAYTDKIIPELEKPPKGAVLDITADQQGSTGNYTLNFSIQK